MLLCENVLHFKMLHYGGPENSKQVGHLFVHCPLRFYPWHTM